jgi:hypothetical protein
MPDPGHLEMLSRGVKPWNEWRSADPGISPDLSGSNIKIKKLSGIDLSHADLKGTMFTGADLSGSDLQGADLSHADLMEANLRGARMNGAVLRSANLMGADLRRADLTGAVLDGAILYRADLEGTECVNSCLWLKALMDFAVGLMNVESGMEGALIESSFVSTQMSRLEIELSDPISIRATYEILGALNRLYGMVSSDELPGPIISVGGGEQKGGDGEQDIV